MSRIDRCVERIQLAFLSREPFVWIVVQEKETAALIADTFLERHVGVQDGSTIDDYPYKSINNFNSKGPMNALRPCLCFDWIDTETGAEKNNGSAPLASHMENFIDYYYNVRLSAEVRANMQGAGYADMPFDHSIAIFASPYPPVLGWLNGYIEVIYLEGQSDDDIKETLARFTRANGIPEFGTSFTDRLVVNFRGMSEREVSQVLYKCMAMGYFDDPDDASRRSVLNEARNLKRQKLDGFSGLKWVDVGDDDITASGLGGVTGWLGKRIEIFSDPQKKYREGFDVPKGLLITGIPGTGKSLMAKTSAKMLNLPLVTMDLGDLQEGIVGKSEEHMAAALRLVDDMAPCVLWIDEIEKAFSGSGSGSSDGGVMQRMFGKFLTWMQEKKSFCFVLATSNDITHLPPELFRSERFDEKFYTFMPTAEECAQIFVSCVNYHNRRYRKANGKAAVLFDASIFENGKIWMELLNRRCVDKGDGIHRPVYLERDDDDAPWQWKDGVTPQWKFFTGADISAFVKAVKFAILTARQTKGSATYGVHGVIGRKEYESVVGGVLADFKPYGQTNLQDIGRTFLSLAKNRFRPASGNDGKDGIVDFNNFNGTTSVMGYDEHRFTAPGQEYDRALYSCVVGAVNSLQKAAYRPKTKKKEQ